MTNQTIYTVGGTVQAGGGIYIKRKADDELIELCRQGEFAFILSSRQVGKSSLMVRTAQQLEKENIQSVIIDLSAIGVKVSQDEWYLGILNEISTSLDLKIDIFSWWEKYAQLGPSQRLTTFFRDVLLKEVNEQIVLFFDEIDSTLSIPFSDDFYIALRAVYNARSTTPGFKRLSFVLVGVAAPSDLISDNKRTPFNIGRRVEINDFTLEEALPLAAGLGQQAIEVLTWIFQYTGGHPYLTQRLCAYLSKSKETVDEHVVAGTVERLFTGEEGKQDNNLQFVRDMLSRRSPDVTKVLLTYRSIRSGRKVTADERSITQAHLKLSGLVRSEHGILQVRNEIYNTVFNLRWIQENTPRNWQKAALISLSAALAILLLGTLTVFINDFMVGSKIDNHFRDFISATSPVQRLSDLAEIYKQEGILSNKDSNLTGSQLFYGLSSAEDQLAIFKAYEINQSPDLQNDLVFVISHLYITVANVDPEEDNTALLQTMHDALSNISNDQAALDIQNEIAAWLDGRKKTKTGNYEAALESYNKALSLNSGNHATLYERAKVYVALKQYSNALKDLDDTIGFAKQSAPDIDATPTLAISPFPASATPGFIEGQATSDILPSGLTSIPSEIGLTPTKAFTPTLESAQSPTPNPFPTYAPGKKYESNFTTLIDVVNAVQSLIENTPQFQALILLNGESTYANLQALGLVSIISPTPSLTMTLSTSSVNEQPSSVTKTTEKFYDLVADTELINTSCTSDWNVCRNSTSAYAGWQDLSVATVGEGYASSGYTIQRYFLFINTISIPSDAVVQSATLYLYVSQFINGDTTFHIVRSFSEIPPLFSDFQSFEHISGGSVSPNQNFTWVSIELNLNAISWINKGGITKIALIHDSEIKDIPPTGSENNVLIATAEDNEHSPFIEITYSP